MVLPVPSTNRYWSPFLSILTGSGTVRIPAYLVCERPRYLPDNRLARIDAVGFSFMNTHRLSASVQHFIASIRLDAPAVPRVASVHFDTSVYPNTYFIYIFYIRNHPTLSCICGTTLLHSVVGSFGILLNPSFLI
jgi:hypothetical protein